MMDSRERRSRASAASGGDEAALQERLQYEIQQRRRKALLNLLQNNDFKVFFAWLQEKTNVNGEVFYGNSRDTYDKGRRSVGLMVLGEVLQLGEVGLQFRHESDLQYMHDRKMIQAALLDNEGEDKRK